MASITIRNLDDEVKTKLRVRVADNGRSMEQEVRLILRDAVGQEDAPAKGLGTAIHELFSPSAVSSWSCRTASRCGSCSASIETVRDGSARYECGVRNDARLPTSGGSSSAST